MKGPLAQLAEHRTFNPGVVGSIPTRPTTLVHSGPCHHGYSNNPGMDSLHVVVEIAADAQNVSHVLQADENLRAWSATSCEGSYAQGDWNGGGIVRFATLDGQGMVSLVEQRKALPIPFTGSRRHHPRRRG